MSTEVRRFLSPVERWYWIVDQVSPLNVIARVRLTGHLPGEVLESAAAGLTNEHPLLRVAIRANPDGTQPEFVPSLNVATSNIGRYDFAERIGDWRLIA